MSNAERTSRALTDLLDSCDATIIKLQHLERAIGGAASLCPDIPETYQCHSILRVLSEYVGHMWCDIDSNLSTFRGLAEEGNRHE
jgi:hypothetical protein